jgi:aspartokinase
LDARGVIAVIGAALDRDAALRASVLGELARFAPDLAAVGASAASVAAVVDEARLDPALAALHTRFIEPGGLGAA